MSAINQKEYLKRYLSGGDSNKKKKKKNKATKKKGIVIVDEDIGSFSNIPFGNDEADDAPTVAEITYDSAKTKEKDEYSAISDKWKNTLDKDEKTEKESLSSKIKSIGANSEFTNLSKSLLKKKRHDSDDESPQRKKRHDSEDESPQRKKRHDSEDESPPRKKRHDSEDESPPRKKRHDSNDESPPRKKRHDSDDGFLPRKNNSNDKATSERYISKKTLDKNKLDSDESPPRRKRNQADSDESPPGRKRKPADSDESPPRRNRKPADSDESPPRRKKRMDSDESPPRINAAVSDKPQRIEKTMTTQEYLMARKRGKLKKDSEEDIARKEREGLLQKAAEQQHKLWNKGMTQVHEREQRIADMQHEMGKSLARTADDKDMNNLCKSRILKDDPMLEYLQNKTDKKDSGPRKPLYQGNFPPNRFNIRPGYRWDGVDRSNGFEQEYINKQSNAVAIEEDAYKYCAEDM